MSDKQLENVSFDFIRYANCWEDPRMLLQSLGDSEGHGVISIASAGDNSFSLLTLDPKYVLALDISAVQLYLVELKKLAISKLRYEEFLQFMGFKASINRGQVFDKLKSELSPNARTYWEANREVIASGVIFQGKFEKFFLYFKKKILPFIHSQKRVEELLRPKSAEEQERFFHDKWNSWRWRKMYPLVFNKHIFGKYARDPEFMKHVETTVPEFIKNVATKHYSSVYCFENPFLWFFLTGSFQNILPHYVQPENFEVIQNRIDRFTLFEGLIEDGLSDYKDATRFNLSNIFEYMDVPLFKSVADKLISQSGDKAIFAYWNLMIDRKIAEHFPERVKNDKGLSERLSVQDHGYFYKSFNVDYKQ
ncbi:DUF3419 family protein [Owenweeksia hongkongensis]|uniref:DUF3419 family protein n=1 Tax=Owenweeksia hongkongensis TaxID=253245 RepID=UPI003A90750C